MVFQIAVWTLRQVFAQGAVRVNSVRDKRNQKKMWHRLLTGRNFKHNPVDTPERIVRSCKSESTDKVVASP